MIVSRIAARRKPPLTYGESSTRSQSATHAAARPRYR
jgi:hypothetical protein